MSDYPEHEKLSAVRDKSQVCGEFYDWLASKKGVQFDVDTEWCRICGMLYKDGEEPCECELPEPEVLCGITYKPSPKKREGVRPLRESVDDLLAEFFELDPKALEAEKRQMLKKAREEG